MTEAEITELVSTQRLRLTLENQPTKAICAKPDWL